MDWVTPLISAGAAIFGAGVVSYFSVKSQNIAQQGESVRHTRRIAYETAVKEWEFFKDMVIRQSGEPSTGTNVKRLYPLEDFIIHHLSLVEMLEDVSLKQAGSSEIAEIVTKLKRRSRDVSALKESRLSTDNGSSPV